MNQVLETDRDGEMIRQEKPGKIGRRNFLNRYAACGNTKWPEAVVKIGGFNGNVLRCQEFLNLLKGQCFAVLV